MNELQVPEAFPGRRGQALLRAVAATGRGVFDVADAREVGAALGIDAAHVPPLLQTLAEGGWLRRIKRGTYVVTGLQPNVSSVHPFAVGNALLQPSAVSGWSALNHHGLTEQIPRTVTLTTPSSRRGSKREWKLGGERFDVIVVVPKHFFGIADVWLGNEKVSVFDKERALLDCFALPARFGGIAAGLDIIESHLHELDVPRLVDYALRYGVTAVAKRVGWALEHAGVAESALAPLRALRATSYSLLDPTRPATGVRRSRWHLRENLGGKKRRS